MPKRAYIANNSIQGLGKKTIETGERVELDEDVAAPLVSGGSLSPASAAPAPPVEPPPPPVK